MFRKAELDPGSAVGFNNPQRRTVTADCLGRQARIDLGPVERDRFRQAESSIGARVVLPVRQQEISCILETCHLQITDEK
jgi:hypothetical protein